VLVCDIKRVWKSPVEVACTKRATSQWQQQHASEYTPQRRPAKSKTRAGEARVQVTEMIKVAGATGLEPAAFGVTGRRSNQLSYAPAGMERT
jgi:hypothetical protein